MRRILRATAALAILPSLAVAQPIVDQQQLGFIGNLSNITQWIGQTFVPTYGNVSGLGLRVSSGSPNVNTGTLTFQLWTKNPSLAGAQRLATKDSLITFTRFQSTFVDMLFQPVGVTAGSTYWFGALMVGSNTLWNAGGNADNYANGVAYASSSALVSAPQYGPQTGYDFTFRTYSTVVPEPATFALLSAGLLVIGAVARRQRHQRATTSLRSPGT